MERFGRGRWLSFCAGKFGWCWRCLVIVGLWRLAQGEVHGHGDVHLRIEAVTKDIGARTNDAQLYLLRADLWRLDGQWTNALADLERAASLNRALPGLEWLRGRTLFDAGRWREAEENLTRFLGVNPNHAEALLFRGRARARMGEVLRAAEDLDRVIALQPAGGPDVYLERSQVLRRAGTNEWGRALSGLEEGRRRMGRLVTLDLAALEIELDLGKTDEALQRLEYYVATAPRKESWLVRRGDILKRAGRRKEAREAYEGALNAVVSLPARLRNTRAMAELESRMRKELGSGGD